MRQEIYDSLVRLPLKIVGAAGSAVGFIGSVWPDKVKTMLGDGVSAETIRTAGMILLAVGVVYFAVLWLLKPPAARKAEAVGLSANTAGHGAHAIAAHSVRDVYINTPTTPPVSPLVAAYTDPVSRHVEEADLYRDLKPEPKGDLEFTKLNARLYKLIGPRPSDTDRQPAFDRKLNLEILDQVANHPLSVWARVADGPRRKIHRATLERARFDHRRVSFSVLGIDSVHPTIYRDVLFNTDQVVEVWPL